MIRSAARQPKGAARSQRPTAVGGQHTASREGRILLQEDSSGGEQIAGHDLLSAVGGGALRFEIHASTLPSPCFPRLVGRMLSTRPRVKS
jgi:hypothetical protein